ncbi:MAG: nitrite/sulfite reductase [Aeromicrobium sp.]|uniref:nitrite/sulfite reductase n=1 Tax=Aeromicrobium sp. TaxID=1871063 RepID=UPI0039E4E966
MAPPPSTRPARRPRKKRGEGQWALGYREPLNANEQSKKDDNPLNVRARIENIYSRRGFDSIDPGDLRGRFRWWGLYTQRKPGIDGGKTATLEPEELDDRYFMMRVRVDGGQLNLEQLRTIAGISTEFARDTADLTDRQNVQYHWIDVVDVPTIWERLESVGLSTQEACGDCPRVILGSPVAGVSADELIDGRPAIDAIESRYIGDRAFSNLPRKFKSAISGHPGHDVVPQINDIAFIGAVHPEHGPGFDLWVGGGLSTNPMLAQRVGAWVPIDEVPEVWEGVVSIFRDYGYRRLRARARLKFLVADWGVEKFREVLETEYLKRPLIDLEAPEVPATPVDHVGAHRQVDGNYYVGFANTVGRVSGTLLAQIADVVEAHGSGRVALTPMQKLIVLDVAEDRVESLIEAMDAIGLRGRPSQWRRNTMACTGIEYCKLAIVETKQRAADLIGTMEDRLPTLDAPITINLNGCPNSCARIQTADIGLKGQLVLNDEGEQVEGFQVHLGGGLGLEAGFGRKLRAHKVTADQLPEYVERLTLGYLEEREEAETFAQWVARADEAALR